MSYISTVGVSDCQYSFGFRILVMRSAFVHVGFVADFRMSDMGGFAFSTFASVLFYHVFLEVRYQLRAVLFFAMLFPVSIYVICTLRSFSIVRARFFCAIAYIVIGAVLGCVVEFAVPHVGAGVLVCSIGCAIFHLAGLYRVVQVCVLIILLRFVLDGVVAIFCIREFIPGYCSS